MIAAKCKCCSGLTYANCCQPFHVGEMHAPTPEKLMRSRYVAYTLHFIDYLMATTHPSTRNLYDRKSIEHWAKSNKWLKLEVLQATNDYVEFKAYYEHRSKIFIHHENSRFKKEQGIWYYYSGS